MSDIIDLESVSRDYYGEDDSWKAEDTFEDMGLCDCGEPFPDSGYCRFCGAHARYGREL